MPWHIEFTRATARYFSDSSLPAEESFRKRVEPDVLAQVDLEAGGRGYIHATMSRAKASTSVRAWRGLARKLRALGVKVLDWEHSSKASSIDPARAWADTVAVDG